MHNFVRARTSGFGSRNPSYSARNGGILGKAATTLTGRSRPTMRCGPQVRLAQSLDGTPSNQET